VGYYTGVTPIEGFSVVGLLLGAVCNLLGARV